MKRRSIGLMRGLWLLPVMVVALPWCAPALDVTPPELVSFDFTPGTVDVTSAGQNLEVNLHVREDLSGLDYVLVRFDGNMGVDRDLECWISDWDRVSGDGFDGTYQAWFWIPQYCETGTLKCVVETKDYAGNSLTLYSSNLVAKGFPGQLVVTGMCDTNPPVLASFDFEPKSLNNTSGSTPVTFTFRMTDSLSGLGSSWDFGWGLTLASPLWVQEVYVDASYPDGLISGDEFDGTYEWTVEIPQYSMTGKWTVAVYAHDNLGNWIGLNDSELAGLGYPSELNVTGISDTNPPQLVEWDFTPRTVDVTTAEQEITFTARITDNLSGAGDNVGWVELVCGEESVGEGFYFPDHLVAGNALEGWYQFSVTLPQLADPGTYRIGYLDLYDSAGNSQSLTYSNMVQRGLPAELVVTRDDTFDGDHDGSPDWHEVAAGTDREDSQSVFRVTNLGTCTGGMVLSWSSVEEHYYAILGTTNLNEHPTNFLMVGQMPTHPPLNVYTDTVPRPSPFYYRIESYGWQ